MTQNERYHARRARGQCALCVNQVDEIDGRQPWCCFDCRVKMAAIAKRRRAEKKHPQIAIFNGPEFVDVSDMGPEAAAAFVRGRWADYKCLVHICDVPNA